MCFLCYFVYMLYFDDFAGFLADSALSKCSLTALSTLGWNTPSANSPLVIFAGCFLNFTLLMVNL
jgi:hypothetical protein